MSVIQTAGKNPASTPPGPMMARQTAPGIGRRALLATGAGLAAMAGLAVRALPAPSRFPPARRLRLGFAVPPRQG